MIHCEEKLLKSIILSVKSYASTHLDDSSFYGNIRELEGLSLQRVSLSSDLEYFDEIKKLLGILATIVTRPHIVNARETIILRAEQAHGLTPEMFIDTVKDEKLWKDKNGVMTPAEVYYFQNIDELKSYENRFIVHLIDVLAMQLSDYGKFYDFLVGTLTQNSTLTQDDSSLEKAYDKLAALTKKIRRIKQTDFYKIVSKANTHFTHVEATNIFKHNRAYGACYRFYIENVTYGDEEARANDMAVYYFTRLLLALGSCGYKVVSKGKSANGQMVRPMRFESDNFVIDVESAKKYGGLYITINHKELSSDAAVKNLLVCDSTINFEEVTRNLEKYKHSGATAVDAVTLWDGAYVENGKVMSLDDGGISENALLRRYLEEKTRMHKASRQIYMAHCPACGGTDIKAGEHYYSCPTCGTDYTFVGDKIWITKLRKK